MPDLSRSVALVTGGGRGVGRAAAIGLAREGATVGVLARTSAQVEETVAACGPRAVPLQADVTDASAVRGAVETLQGAHGPIDLLVTAAGAANAIGPLWEIEPERWWADVEVDLRGTAVALHAVLPSMRVQRRGRIVTVYGDLGASPGAVATSAFATAKAGVLRLTEHVAAEVVDDGITVVALHPGLVRTAMTIHFATDPAVRRWLPRFAERPASDYDDGGRAAKAVVAIARGAADGLHGLLLGAGDDLEALAADAGGLRAREARRLGVRWT
ncbi:N/A [soil metagenome]